MKKKIYFILLSMFIISITFAQTDKSHIAILNLEPVGISEQESITLTDRLRNEIQKTNTFILIERSAMDEILKEQGLQLSGCTSNECAVEAGQLLNVRQICVGSIGKVGNLYTVAIRLIDVESGAIIKSVTEDCECPVEEVLTSSMRNVALKLAGKMVNEAEANIFGEGEGDIYIKTHPSGAEITLDNSRIEQLTPAILKGISAGQHVIKVNKGDLSASKVILVKANEISEELLNLDIIEGGFKIYSTPAEAEVYVNGTRHGKTPLIVRNLSDGFYQVELKKEGYVSLIKTLEVKDKQFSNVDERLKKMSSIMIESEPSEADVFFNDNKKGITPIKIDIIPDKSHEIKVVKENYEFWNQAIKLEPGVNTELLASLKIEKGKLVFSGFPDGARFKMNDKINQLGNEEIVFPVGQYSLKVFKNGYESKKIDIKIQSKKTENIDASLKRKTKNAALIRSIFIPGFGQKYQDKKKRSWLYPFVFVGTGVGSIYYTNVYNSDVSDYHVVRKEYLAAFEDEDIHRLRKKMDNAYNDINSSEKKRNIFYVATATVWLGNVLDAIFLPPGWKNKIDIKTQKQDDKITAGLIISF